MELILSNKSVDAASVANDLFLRIKDIEKATEDATSNVSQIESRGWLKSLVSSTSSDLVAISKSQNKINEMLVGMINEVIRLNVMSYSVLAAVLAEFSQRVSEGMTDTNGNVIKLSKVGKDVADSAALIFNKILDGSRSTQEKIELTEERVEEIREALVEKDYLDQQQSKEIANLQHSIEEKAHLDAHQSMEIKALGETVEAFSQQALRIEAELEKSRASVSAQDKTIDGLRVALGQSEARCGALEAEHGSLKNGLALTFTTLDGSALRLVAMEATIARLRFALWGGLGATAVVLIAIAARAFGFY